MVDNKQRTTLKKLARWSPSTNTNKNQLVLPLSQEAPFTHVPHDKLQQGGLYILKIKQVSLALFEGWDDDMCCFSILRSEVEPMRWSEARQLPGDFDIYDAFDECGNPPIHLWTRYLRVNIPVNWFSMFEEAKRRQRDWAIQQHHMRRSLISNHDYYNAPPPVPPVPVEQSVYSNTDVSSMQLNQTTSPSMIAASSSQIITSPSPVILSDTPAMASSYLVNPDEFSPALTHRRSKEHVDTPLPTPPDQPLHDSSFDFPHDSDRFSIRSDMIQKRKSLIN